MEPSHFDDFQFFFIICCRFFLGGGAGGAAAEQTHDDAQVEVPIEAESEEVQAAVVDGDSCISAPAETSEARLLKTQVNFHGDLSRHLIRNYLYEFVGKSMDICISGMDI